MKRDEGQSVNCGDGVERDALKANICDLERDSLWRSAKSSSVGVGIQIARGFALMYYPIIASQTTIPRSV
jgi:hypothetical protein